MTTTTVPPLTIRWRLKMALDHGEISAQTMADELGVHRATLTRWMNVDGVPIRAIYLKQWAIRTGVDYDWLATGHTVSPAKPFPLRNVA